MSGAVQCWTWTSIVTVWQVVVRVPMVAGKCLLDPERCTAGISITRGTTGAWAGAEAGGQTLNGCLVRATCWVCRGLRRQEIGGIRRTRSPAVTGAVSLSRSHTPYQLLLQPPRLCVPVPRCHWRNARAEHKAPRNEEYAGKVASI